MTARVLLVEDDLDAIIIYSATLRYLGFKVRSAARVSAAEAMVGRWPPDVVVLDAKLPDGDGLALLARWREKHGWLFPVVMLTGYPERELHGAAMRAGIDAFVAKPCSGATLGAHITRILTTARTSQSRVRRKSETNFARDELKTRTKG